MKASQMTGMSDLVGMIKSRKSSWQALQEPNMFAKGSWTSLCEINDTQGLDWKEQGRFRHGQVNICLSHAFVAFSIHILIPETSAGPKARIFTLLNNTNCVRSWCIVKGWRRWNGRGRSAFSEGRMGPG
jgi:hypothetical protein